MQVATTIESPVRTTHVDDEILSPFINRFHRKLHIAEYGQYSTCQRALGLPSSDCLSFVWPLTGEHGLPKLDCFPSQMYLGSYSTSAELSYSILDAVHAEIYHLIITRNTE